MGAALFGRSGRVTHADADVSMMHVSNGAIWAITYTSGNYIFLFFLPFLQQQRQNNQSVLNISLGFSEKQFMHTAVDSPAEKFGIR